MPTLDLLPLVEAILSRYPSGCVPVLKIDGGLDGMSSVQAVRRVYGKSHRPIISSYPLLSRSLRNYLPGNTFAHFLGLSGVDIIYPGGRPLLPHELRPIWAEEAAAVLRSVDAYRAIIKRGWPMPVLGGGIHPGQIHTLYELFGPNVGIFLGGAIALHRGGPAEGAKVCVQIVREAERIAARSRMAGVVSDEMLPRGLVLEIEKAYEDVVYLPPGRLLSTVPRLRRWYR